MGEFFCMISSKITPAKKKESGRRKKGGEEKKAMVSLLAFLLAFHFGKLFDGKGLFSGNVFKTSARHIHASVIALPKVINLWSSLVLSKDQTRTKFSHLHIGTV